MKKVAQGKTVDLLKKNLGPLKGLNKKPSLQYAAVTILSKSNKDMKTSEGGGGASTRKAKTDGGSVLRNDVEQDGSGTIDAIALSASDNTGSHSGSSVAEVSNDAAMEIGDGFSEPKTKSVS